MENSPRLKLALEALEKYLLYKRLFDQGEHDDENGVNILKKKAERLGAGSMWAAKKLITKEVDYVHNHKPNPM